MGVVDISYGFAFLAGIASFLSPCVFSLVPAYISYLGGRSVASTTGGAYDRWITLTHGLAFVVGFSLVFISLGAATSALGGILYGLRIWLTRIGGVLVIILGLHMTGIIRIPFLEVDLRPQTAPDRNRGYLASLLMGVFFSAGWSPCVGPVLGSILTLSLSEGSITKGIGLLAVYSLGLGLPFLFASTQISLVTKVIRRYGKVMRYIEIGMGVLLVIIGVLLLLGRFQTLASLNTFFSIFDEIQVGRLILLIFVGLVVLGLLPAYLAYRKGRNFIDWWFFGAGLFPVALIIALMLRPVDENQLDDTRPD